jgi:hypothetical protein
MLKSYLCIAGGLVGIVVGIKLLFFIDRFDDTPQTSPTRDKIKIDDSEVESSSDEETVIVENELSSRSGHTIKSKFERKVMKLSHMKKQDLIDECVRRNIACAGTVRVLRERLRVAREEEKA